MVSSGRFCAGNGRFTHDRVRWRSSGPSAAGLTGVFAGFGGLFPWLRRKSGLCYTADANSPFEAYIYVC
jgi:hypothetical protein